jgi:hypothetical protein|tara:strand:- start:453 stop:818 length:366 start_codon:yes stop_codon:yes gene_type:complete
MTKKNVWSVEELVSLTSEVQTGAITYRGREFGFQFCELKEKEEPKIKWLPENVKEEERAAWATEIGVERILLMIDKANKKNPDGATITSDNWNALPATLRYTITSEILQVETQAKGNFTIG